MFNDKAWIFVAVCGALTLLFFMVPIWPFLTGSNINQPVVVEVLVTEPIVLDTNMQEIDLVELESHQSEVVEPEIIIVADENDTAKTIEGLYSVIDGNKLDANSYAGFKLYRNWCARCHGTYGQGLVGPNLADSLNVISKEQFFDTVENGKAGSIGSMPAWKTNMGVMDGLDKLYAYLMARADGAIGVVKPKKQ